jgi:hypothetical protein
LERAISSSLKSGVKQKKMTKKIIWRLGEKPTTKSLQELVSTGILTKDEARQVLFNETEESERTIESYQQEIKFLRELIEKLSNKTQIIEVIKEVYKPYYGYQWCQPYYGWSTITCGTSSTLTSIQAGDTSYGTLQGQYNTPTSVNFSNIQTF